MSKSVASRFHQIGAVNTGTIYEGINNFGRYTFSLETASLALEQ
jgi:hypothetical protein